MGPGPSRLLPRRAYKARLPACRLSVRTGKAPPVVPSSSPLFLVRCPDQLDSLYIYRRPHLRHASDLARPNPARLPPKHQSPKRLPARTPDA
jgi:hypothetical protein